MKKYMVALIAASMFGLIGCEQKGPVTKAGERMDEAIDNVKHGDSPLKEKGALEKAGEAIDDAAKTK